MHLNFLKACAVAIALVPAVAAAQDVATLGGVKITADDARRLAGQLPPERRRALLNTDQGLENLVREELLLRALAAEADAGGWAKTPDVAAAAEFARERVVATTYLDSVTRLPEGYPDEAAIKAFYDANQKNINVPPRYRLAQILVARPKGDAEVPAALARAADITRRARAPGADFAALARAESADAASRDKGGDVGWFPEPNVLPEFRGALQRMKPGDVSDPIANVAGWHILRLTEAEAAQPATLEQARSSIIQELRARRSAELKRAYIDALLKKTPVALDAAALGALREKLK